MTTNTPHLPYGISGYHSLSTKLVSPKFRNFQAHRPLWQPRGFLHNALEAQIQKYAPLLYTPILPHLER